MFPGCKFSWRFVMILCLTSLAGYTQRNYVSSSVLSTGTWYKMSTTKAGVYKIDIPFLSQLGFPGTSIPSSSIRIFGNGGLMLPEKPGTPVPDDLSEIAIWTEDGGDGILNGADYMLFYSPGPHQWTRDPVSGDFKHLHNIYSDESYYYISTGAEGKRISTATIPQSPTVTINSFDERLYHELDTFNFLSSGKNWFGEEFSSFPGKSLVRQFVIPAENRVETAVVSIKAKMLSRSFGSGGQFQISLNNQPFGEVRIDGVQTGPYDIFANAGTGSFQGIVSLTNLDLRLTYTPGSSNAQGWLDWYEISYRRRLSILNQLIFRDRQSVSPGAVGRFVISNANSALNVWDISNSSAPLRMNGTFANNEYSFVGALDSLKEYIAFANIFLVPEARGRVLNQNLHLPVQTDYIIISNPILYAAAQRLAAFHQESGLSVLTVTTDQVFNEFSSGMPDPGAIRNFVKMFHDRAGTDSTLRPKYLLLFGDASFDYKSRLQNNSSLLPAYESEESLDPLTTYVSDDFFGFLDDAEDINGTSMNLLDIGIGRVPAGSAAEANAYVDKLIAYHSPASLGAWRSEISFIADDEDANLHLQDAEAIALEAVNANPVYNRNKYYLDLYPQESGTGGASYPAAQREINSRVNNGTLIYNYSGHGGYRRLAEEVVLDQEIINEFNNVNRLPLFVTATCDFAPYDNPLINSIGENLLLRPETGAIALMTTTRLVFAFSNRVMNQNYLQVALKQLPDGSYPSLGQAVRRAKNITYQFSGDVINNRKFTLLGDPATTLAFPRHQVHTNSVNGVQVTAIPDTLKALNTYSIEGIVTDYNGNLLNGFNGMVNAVVFDKPQAISTLGNDPGSIPVPVDLQKNIIFRGKAQTTNGRFTLRFIVPKDINYRFGEGRISYYVENGEEDGIGADTKIIIGGSGDSIADKEGPDINLYLNDEKFISGGIINSNPILIVKLLDSSGINTMGSGIGHDLVAILNNDPSKQYILNEFYESEPDDFKRGIVRFQLPDLEEGTYTLTVKAWDIANNSGEKTIEFRVIKAQDLTLRHVLNYPNPFTTRTNFWFEHNRPPGEELRVTIQVYTVTGKLVKTLRNTIITEGNRSSDIEWNGRDEYGQKIGRGVYIYNLKVQSSDGKTAQKLEKLYIL